MSRVQCTTDPSGGSPYTFQRNPSEYEGQDSINATAVKILHGAPTWHLKKWDSRPRTLKWSAVGATSTVDATGAIMVDTMRGWVGTVRYFNFQNIARINENWPNGADWNKARVIDLKMVARKGGNLRYGTVELILQPES